jgi:serine/threonine-protein kinase HipA
MTLAAKAGIDVSETRVIKAGNSCLYLVERFDRRQGYRHYLSAASLFNRHSLRPSDFSGSYSYPGLAQLITKISQDVYAQQAALFRRMVFNFFMHNTDDHARNHGFLMVAPDNFALSPAFDLLPHLNADEHALGLGIEGRTATLANCLSRCEQFGLKNDQAKSIVEEVGCTTTNWQNHFATLGVKEQDISLLQRVIRST